MRVDNAVFLAASFGESGNRPDKRSRINIAFIGETNFGVLEEVAVSADCGALELRVGVGVCWAGAVSAA